MYLLRWDEAWSSEKEHQCIAALLCDEEESGDISASLKASWPLHELKFARVRYNDSYLQEVKTFLDAFFTLTQESDLTLMVILGSSSSLIWDEMYDELFLLSQSIADDEIRFAPDKNNVLSRWNHGPRCKEFGIVGIQEQDSQQEPLIQMMDIISGITIFLREHAGTYMIRNQSSDRYEQMEEFERELHIRCELVAHFLNLIERSYGPVSISEKGIWSVESERVVVMEF
jgi:hypothetical protein